MGVFKKYLYGRSDTAGGHEEKETQHSLPMMTMPTSAFSSSSHLPEDPETQQHHWDTLALWLYTCQERRAWTRGLPDEGVFLKRAQGEYSMWPPNLDATANGLTSSLKTLNVKVQPLRFYATETEPLTTTSSPQ